MKPGESLDDLNYLAALLTQRSNEERDKFAAAAQYGDHAASAADLINLTHNLDCYWLYPTVHNSDDYGHYLIDDLDELELPDAAKRFFDYKSYGYHHSTDDGKYLIMGNGTQAFAIAAEQREQENYMRTAELSTEQNYNMIDGQINNTPSVDELEEKAKRGEVISLSALAAAVKAEDGRTPQRDPDGKKPSIRAQLKADRAQSCKPQQREKEQEAKRSIRQALEME